MKIMPFIYLVAIKTRYFGNKNKGGYYYIYVVYIQ